ncbi:MULTISPECIES: hypothetical protein [unclassified Pannonibacter]|uniref:hypothetical protein n=1 Tax=unclassified Pannonibacter TaxID=2627228 RepID=UPI0016454C1B|nr:MULTISPECIES: hypothetical protein [unclassified Pannonibacter]
MDMDSPHSPAHAKELAISVQGLDMLATRIRGEVACDYRTSTTAARLLYAFALLTNKGAERFCGVSKSQFVTSALEEVLETSEVDLITVVIPLAEMTEGQHLKAIQALEDSGRIKLKAGGGGLVSLGTKATSLQ